MKLSACLASIFPVACSVAAAAANEPETCGPPETPCLVPGGEYFLATAQDATGAPVVLWLHGYGRSGGMMVANRDAVEPFTSRGYAVVFPTGQPFVAGTGKLDWGVEDGAKMPRDDVSFLRTTLADAVSRFGLDGTRVLAAGFSRGGSMVWDLACEAPDTATAYAAVAGAFWEPMSARCAAPVHLFHTHGFNDDLVPFEGREVVFADIAFTQGSVMKGIDIWRRTNGCMGGAENEIEEGGEMRKVWTGCDAGSITLTLAPIGHSVPDGWRTDVLDWFEALTTPQDEVEELD